MLTIYMQKKYSNIAEFKPDTLEEIWHAASRGHTEP
jgi:hypothetical protein